MESYHKLLTDIISDGEERGDRTGTGTLSVFGPHWQHDMRTGFPLLTTKRVPMRWVAEELFWFLSGSTDVRDLQARGVTIWDDWSTQEQCARFGRIEGNLGPVYGKLWRDFPTGHLEGEGMSPAGVDQIAGIVDDIANSPESRRIICSGWHPYYQKRVALPPCHTLFQMYCHVDGGLSLQLYARSIDAFLGLPFNIASYGLLLEMLAAVTGRHARNLIIRFGDLHLYSNHIEQAKLQLQRAPCELPTLELDVPQADTPLKRLLAFRYDHVGLKGYKSHPKITADVAV